MTKQVQQKYEIIKYNVQNVYTEIQRYERWVNGVRAEDRMLYIHKPLL